MSFMDKVKQGMNKAKGEVSDFAATAKIRHEISNLNDCKSALFDEIGRQVYALSQQGHPVSEVRLSARRLRHSTNRSSRKVTRSPASMRLSGRFPHSRQFRVMIRI